MGRYRSPEGQTFEVPDSQIDWATSQGFVPMTDEQRHEDIVQQALTARDNERGTLGSVNAGLTSFVSGATLGGSDILLDALGTKGTTERIAADRRAHPNISIGGQIVGGVAPLLIPGGQFTPAGALSKVGSKVVGLGEGAGFVGKTAASTAGAAIEGAGQSGGSYLSQVALEDKPLSAEGFVGAMGNGALFGGAIGGGLSIAESTLMRAKALFPRAEVTREAAKKIDEEAQSAIRTSIDDGVSMQQTARQKIDAMRIEAAQAELAAKKQVADINVQRAQSQLERQQAMTARTKAGRTRKVFDEPVGEPAPIEPTELSSPVNQATAPVTAAASGRPSASSISEHAVLSKQLDEISDPSALDRIEIDADLESGRVVPWNDAFDTKRTEAIADSMRSHGWVGDPLVVVNSGHGKMRALTGSHRLAAAEEVGIKVPVVTLDLPEGWKSTWEGLFRDGELVSGADEAVDLLAADGVDPRIVKLLREIPGDGRPYIEQALPPDIPPEPPPVSQATAPGPAVADDLTVPPTKSQVPEYEELNAKLDADDDLEWIDQTLPAREIFEHGYYEPTAGGHVDAVRSGKAAQAIREGQRDPIRLLIDRNGKITVDDGRHRLAAAIEQNAPIKVQWSTGGSNAKDQVLRGGKPDGLEQKLQETKSALDSGTSLASLSHRDEALVAARPEAAKLVDAARKEEQTRQEVQEWISGRGAAKDPAVAPAAPVPTAELPTYEALADGDLESTVSAKALAEHGYHEPNPGSLDSSLFNRAKEAMREGQRDPVVIRITPNGEYVVKDGRYRIQAAIENDLPVKVTWEPTDEIPKGHVARSAPSTEPGRPLNMTEYTDLKDVLFKANNDSLKALGFKHSKDELLAAGMYYSKGGDEVINGAFRKEKPVPDMAAKAVEVLDGWFGTPSAQLSRDTTLYRGVSGEWSRKHFGGVKPGEILEDKAYLSTASNVDSKVRNEEVVFTIHAPAGTKGLAIPSQFSSEKEILLPRNVKLRVISNELVPQVPTSSRWKNAIDHEVLPDKSIRITSPRPGGGTHSNVYPPMREIEVEIVRDQPAVAKQALEATGKDITKAVADGLPDQRAPRMSKDAIQEWIAGRRVAGDKNAAERGYRVSYETSLGGERTAAGIGAKIDRVTTYGPETEASKAARARVEAKIAPEDRLRILDDVDSMFGKRAPSVGEQVLDSAPARAPDLDAKISDALRQHKGEHVNLSEDLAEAAKRINAHEEASAELAEALGADAPAAAADRAKAYRSATAQHAEASAASAARSADDLANKLAPEVARKTGGAVGGDMLQKLGDLGAGMEILRAMGVSTPDIERIPVIGPVLSMYLKARAAMGVFRRAGGSIPKTAESVIAAKSASTRDRVGAAVSSLLDASAKATRAARPLAGPAAGLSYKLFPGSGGSTKERKTDDAVELFRRRTDELARASQPGAILQAVRDRVKTSDPLLQQEIAAVMQRKLGFLDSKRPREPVLPTLLKGDGEWTPNRVQLMQFGRYMKAAEDPASVLEDVAAGHAVSIEAAETLRTVYPSLYREAQMTLVKLAQDMREKLPYSRRVALSILFRVPVDGTMSPSHIQFLQQGSPAAAPMPAQGSPAPGASPQPAISGPVGLGDRVMTSLDRRAGA